MDNVPSTYVISWELISDGLNFPGFQLLKEPNGPILLTTTVTAIRELGPYNDYKKVANYPVKEVSHG